MSTKNLQELFLLCNVEVAFENGLKNFTKDLNKLIGPGMLVGTYYEFGKKDEARKVISSLKLYKKSRQEVVLSFFNHTIDEKVSILLSSGILMKNGIEMNDTEYNLLIEAWRAFSDKLIQEGDQHLDTTEDLLEEVLSS